MDINNYIWVTGKQIQRPWGVEYRYTVQNAAGKLIDSIVMLDSDSETEETIAGLIAAQLLKIDVAPEPRIDPIEEAVQAKEDEIKDLLVLKELITEEESIYDIKSKADILAEGDK